MNWSIGELSVARRPLEVDGGKLEETNSLKIDVQGRLVERAHRLKCFSKKEILLLRLGKG
jgi:hypothetical protein